MKNKFNLILISFVGFILTCYPHLSEAAPEYNIGASDTEIKIGSTADYTGKFNVNSLNPKAAAAYFNALNEKGGINGRKIVFIVKDDQFEPAKTLEAIKALIEEERVLLIFDTFGSPGGNAVQDYLDKRKIPQLFIFAGNSNFENVKTHPWTLGLWPGNLAKEAIIYGKYILKTWPNAKVGTLLSNNAAGTEYLENFKKSLGDKADSLLVKEERNNVIDQNIDFQIEALKNRHVDVLFTNNLGGLIYALWIKNHKPFTPANYKKMDELDWNPQLIRSYLNAASLTWLKTVGYTKRNKGAISIRYLKDPLDPQWKDHLGMKKYLEFVKKNFPEESPQNIFILEGYSRAQMLEIVLRKSGDILTHKNVMNQAVNLSLTSDDLPLLLPGVQYLTTPTNYSGIQQVQLVRYNGEYWEPIGDLIQLKDIN